MLGPVFGNHTALTYLSWPLFLFVLYGTTFGLALRPVGEKPETAAAAGISVRAIRYVAVASHRLLLSLGLLGMLTDNMTAGRGIIAFVAVVFGRHRPVTVFAVALFFGFEGALTDRLQGFGLPSELLLTLPYLLTVLALAASGWKIMLRGKGVVPTPQG